MMHEGVNGMTRVRPVLVLLFARIAVSPSLSQHMLPSRHHTCFYIRTVSPIFTRKRERCTFYNTISITVINIRNCQLPGTTGGLAEPGRPVGRLSLDAVHEIPRDSSVNLLRRVKFIEPIL